MEERALFVKLCHLGRIILIAVVIITIILSLNAVHVMSAVGSVTQLLGHSFLHISLIMCVLVVIAIIITSVLTIIAYHTQVQYMLILIGWTACLAIFVVSVNMIHLQIEGGLFDLTNYNNTKNDMINVMQEHNWNDLHLLQTSLGIFQSNHGCCGLNEMTETQNEWITSNFFKYQIEFPRHRVPLTCCKTCEVLKQDCHQAFKLGVNCSEASTMCNDSEQDYVDRLACVGQNIPKNVSLSTYLYTDGCFNIISSYITSYLMTQYYMSILLIILIIMQGFIAAKLYIILKNIRIKSENSINQEISHEIFG